MPGLEDLYREIILDHYRNPRNRGELAAPPAQRVEGYNPLCGDEIVVYLLVDGDKVTDVKITGQGCSISQSSASMMSAAVKGKTVDEARALIRAFKGLMSIHESRLEGESDGEPEVPEPEVKLGDLEALQGVVKFPVRIKCATLSWNTLATRLDEPRDYAVSCHQPGDAPSIDFVANCSRNAEDGPRRAYFRRYGEVQGHRRSRNPMPNDNLKSPRRTSGRRLR